MSILHGRLSRQAMFRLQAGELSLCGFDNDEIADILFSLKRLGMKFRKTGGVSAKADRAAQAEFSKKAESIGRIDVRGKCATVFHGCGSRCLRNGFSDEPLVFRANVRSNIKRSKHYNVFGAYNVITKTLLTVVNESYINHLRFARCYGHYDEVMLVKR